MVSKLALFGCSWAYGSELVDPDIDSEITNSYHGIGSDFDRQNHSYRLHHCFGNIISKHYSLEFVNLAEPGNSNFGIFNNFNAFLDTHNHQEYFCVFAMTDSNRYSWSCNNTLEHSSWIQWKKDHSMFASFKNWLTHTNTVEWQTHNENTITRSITSICDNLNIPFVMFNCLPRSGNQTHNNYMWHGHSMQNDLINTSKEKFIYAGGHPTEPGHARISDIVVDFMDSKSIL